MAERMRNRRRSIVVGCALLFVLCTGVTGAIVYKLPTSVPEPPPAPVRDLRTAKVMNDTGADGCSQQTFDNQTWRMSKSKQPCDPVERDANGVAVPTGTIHRLDAIGKSFNK
jgi:hypothetical protein